MQHKFYNEPNKELYVNSLSDKVKISQAKNLFKKISPFESELKTDICEANEEEITFILRQINISSNTEYLRIKRVINDYINFSIKNKLSGNKTNIFKNVIKGFVIDNPVYNKYPRDENDLYDNLVSLFGEPNVDSQYISHFAYLCLVYLQFSDEEILNLQKNNINFEKMMILNKTVSNIFWRPIINSLNTKVLIGRGGKSIDVPLERNNFVIKFIAKDFVKTVKESISKFKRQKNDNFGIKNLSINNIRKAGEYFLYYQQESSGRILQLTDLERKLYNEYKDCYW